MKRKIGLAVCAASLALIFSMNVSANTVTIRKTSGGTAGRVNIRAEISASLRQPASGVNMCDYSATSKITESDELYTNFKITATLSNTTSSHDISKSGFGNSVSATYSMTTQTLGALYDYIHSTTHTESESFGYSDQECNGYVL